MTRNSSRSYSDRTLKLLWGRAAGRCALPTCRIELYVDATDYDPMVIIGEIAHIEASSDSGPRANRAKTKKERDEYDNLILLCKNCHARLDGQKNTNTVEYIRKLRTDHEAWVRNSLPERGKSTTGWAVILLQGAHPFDLERVVTALLPDFPDGDPLVIKAEPEKEEWNSIQRRMVEQVDRLLAADDPFDFRLAVFPLAPVSACLALGYYLTSRPHVRLFQFHRDDRSWAWPDEKVPPQSVTVKGIPQNVVADKGDVAFSFHLSASITEDAIQEVSRDFIGHVNIAVPMPSTGWLRHPDQLNEVARAARQAFEDCLCRYPSATKWHVFFAGPAPAGVSIGQQLNPTMCPPVQLYEFRRDRSPVYQPSIVLGATTND
jgi:hypothetical protein